LAPHGASGTRSGRKVGADATPKRGPVDRKLFWSPSGKHSFLVPNSARNPVGDWLHRHEPMDEVKNNLANGVITFF
jgi:hypothetical protein